MHQVARSAAALHGSREAADRLHSAAVLDETFGIEGLSNEEGQCAIPMCGWGLGSLLIGARVFGVLFYYAYHVIGGLRTCSNICSAGFPCVSCCFHHRAELV